ncbi:MAG: GNAT family N-acetyltransferase [Crocinitomix sp.]|nr:GNAT family N-acetyltransferase [Crocinitomix sp.]
MDFKQAYILENDKVQLRPLATTDFDALLPFSLNEPEIWQYSLVQASGEEQLRNYLKLALDGRALGKEYPFLVIDKKTNRTAGCTRFYDIQPKDKCLLLGYTWYGKDFQGTGLNKQCKYLLLNFAFETLGMERVEFRADNDNKRSIAAMLSIGCKVEGVLRSNGFKPTGERRDSIVLSILKTEWELEVKEQLKNKLAHD